MSVAVGTKFGPYEITGAIGAGGMGEVYRACDTRLGRYVAVKVLPEHMSSSPDSRMRFEREARAVSSLQHPNICVLHDVGHQNGIDYLVMEFLEGETLAQRLQKGPLPLPQLFDIAAQIADALERAHRNGLVHRDLKPGNIMLTKSGAKLMDFGLAKTYPSATTSVLSGMTRSQPLTAEGTLVGTFQYMAPEQIEGREADARSDVFAFGAVLYEMATGKAAFQGRTQASIIAAVLASEPTPLSTVQPVAPASLDRLVRTCLAKDPDERWQSAHDIKLQLQSIGNDGERSGHDIVNPAKRRVPLLVALATVLLLLGLAVGWSWHAPRAGLSVRAALLPHPGSSFSPQLGFAVSPDGEQVIFASSDGTGPLHVRDLRTDTDIALSGTEAGVHPFWSPDGSSIGFINTTGLARINAGGGPVTTLARSIGARGATWGSAGLIVFAPDFGKSGLRMLSADGGPVTELTHVDHARGEDSHRWPFFLPDGRHLLFFKSTAHSTFGVRSDDAVAGVYLLDVKTGKQTFLVHAGSGAEYANGYLFYIVQQNLTAQRFDPSSLRVLGTPIPIAQNVYYNANYWMGGFTTSNRLIAYMGSAGFASELTWFSREGKELGNVDVKGSPYIVSLSPNGKRVATTIGDAMGHTQVWTFDLLRGGETRIASPNAATFDPVWTPDGKMLTYLKARGDDDAIVTSNSDGLGEEQVAVPHGFRIVPTSWSSDGKYLLYMNFAGGKGPRLWVHEAGGTDHALLQEDLTTAEGQFSPNGKWIAYVSDMTGHYEVYVVPFPGAATRFQVSTSGGAQPRWSHDGRQLYYVATDGKLMSVSVMPSSAGMIFGAPKPLFQTSVIQVFEGYAQYDVSPDGRFLINRRTADSLQPITLIANWPEQLKP